MCVCVLFRCGSRACSVHASHAPLFPRAPVFSPADGRASRRASGGENTIRPRVPSGDIAVRPTSPGGGVTIRTTVPPGDETIRPTSSGQMTIRPTSPGYITIRPQTGEEGTSRRLPPDDTTLPDEITIISSVVEAVGNDVNPRPTSTDHKCPTPPPL